MTATKEPMSRLTVPTHIGRVCNTESSRYAMDSVAVLADHRNDNQVFLAATDGRAIAVVPADREQLNNPEASGLTAGWLPRDMGKEGLTVWLSTGKVDTLFGSGIRWVFEHKGELRARDVPEGGQFPPFLDLLPLDVDDCEAITINADALAKLAEAVSDGDFAPGVTIFLPRGDKQRALRVVGNRGIGLIMPIDINVAAKRAQWKSTRNQIQAGRPMPARIRDDGTLGDTEEVDTETGEVRTASPLSPTDSSVAAIGAAVGVGPALEEAAPDAPDDGRDAPSGTWDKRLSVAPAVASKKIDSKCGDKLREAGFSQLNDVQAFRTKHGDNWRAELSSKVWEETSYKLTPRQLDGLDEAIEARLKGQ